LPTSPSLGYYRLPSLPKGSTTSPSTFLGLVLDNNKSLFIPAIRGSSFYLGFSSFSSNNSSSFSSNNSSSFSSNTSGSSSTRGTSSIRSPSSTRSPTSTTNNISFNRDSRSILINTSPASSYISERLISPFITIPSSPY